MGEVDPALILYSVYLAQSRELLERHLRSTSSIPLRERLVIAQAAVLDVLKSIHIMLDQYRACPVSFSQLLKHLSDHEAEIESSEKKGGEGSQGLPEKPPTSPQP